ncbi:MAG: hypothetical protein ACTHJX_09640 [Terriglobales bacterium]
MSWQPSRAGVICLLCLVCGLALTQAPARPNPYPEGDHPEQRVDWFMRFRQSRDSESPAAHRLEALRQARRMLTLHRPRRQELAAAGASPASIGGDWTELGPKPESDPNFGNVGGRLTAIAVDPADKTDNTVYLGAASGGLWKVTGALDTNPTVTPVGDGMASLAVGIIALDASTSPTTIYVGTGEPNNSQDSYYGIGILKSTDGGQTWTQGSGVDFTGSAISKLLVDPVNPQILLASVTIGGSYANNNLANAVPAIGIVRSTDGGQTWVRVYNQQHSVMDLIYDPAGKVYYAAIRSLGIYKSSDQGQTWTPTAAQPFPTMSAQTFYRASFAIRQGALYTLITDVQGLSTNSSDCAGCNGLAISGDGGQTWKLYSPPANMFGSNNQGTYDQFIAAPPGSTALVVGGIDVWSGSYSGTSGDYVWTNLTNSYTSPNITPHPDQHAIVCLSAQQWIIGNDGGAWSTADAGNSWTDMNGGLGAIQFYSVSADPATAGRMIGGSQDNGTASTGSGNLTWSNVFGGDGGHTAINAGNPKQVFTENFGISLRRADDGGGVWTTVVDDTTISSSTDHGEFYIPYALDPTNPASVYLLTQRVWRGPAVPTAKGAGWTPVSGDLTHAGRAGGLDPSGDDLTAVAVAPDNGNVVYVGAFDGSVSRTSNANTAPAGTLPTWAQVAATANGAFTGPVSSIAVSPADAQGNTVYWGLAYLGGSTAYLYKSTDGGQTAINIAGDLPQVPVNAILIDPQATNDIYVATDVGVFVASDGGVANEQWVRLGDNLPAAPVLSLSLTSASGSPVLVAGTHGRGAWSISAISVPHFTLSLTPASLTVEKGQPAVYQLQTTAINGASTITLDCGGTPGCTIAPPSLAAGGLATVTLDSNQTPMGNFTVNANNGYIQTSATARMDWLDFSVVFPDYSTSKSAEVALGQSLQQTLVVNNNGGAGGYDAPVTFSCPNAPAGISCSFSPASLAAKQAGPVNVTLTVQASTGAAAQQAALDVRAVGGTITHDVTLNLAATALSVTAAQPQVAAVVGTGAKFNLTVGTAVQGYSGTVTLGCQTAGVTCSFNPATLNFSGAASQTTQLTVTGFQAPSGASGGPTIVVTATAGSDTAHGSVQVLPQDFIMQPGTVAALPVGVKQASAGVSFVFTNGYAGIADLGCNAPSGVTCTFTPASVSLVFPTSTLVVSGLDTVASTTSLPLTIVGTSRTDGLIHQSTETLNTAGDFGLQLSAVPNPALAGGAAGIEVSANSVNGLSGQLQMACVPGQGVSCNAIPLSIGQYGMPFSIVNLPRTTPVVVNVQATLTANGVTLSHVLAVTIPPGDFSMTPSTPTVSLFHQGGTVNVGLQFQATPGVSAPVNFSCSGYAGVHCSFSATLINNTINVPLVLDAVTGQSSPPGGSGGSGWPWLPAGAVGLLLAAAWLSPRRRRLVAFTAMLLLASAACGGGGGGGGGGSSGGSTFTPVTVPITVTATDATPGLTSPTSHSTTVNLTIY